MRCVWLWYSWRTKCGRKDGLQHMQTTLPCMTGSFLTVSPFLNVVKANKRISATYEAALRGRDCFPSYYPLWDSKGSLVSNSSVRRMDSYGTLRSTFPAWPVICQNPETLPAQSFQKHTHLRTRFPAFRSAGTNFTSAFHITLLPLNQKVSEDIPRHNAQQLHLSRLVQMHAPKRRPSKI